MRELNLRYRGKDRTTDVLSFPMYESPGDIPVDREVPLGDLVINLHAARRQAAEFGNPFRTEVRRLLVHGFLHLLGYDHERNAYQKRRMKARERELLDALETVD